LRLQDIPMQRKLVGSFLLVGCVPAVLLALVGLLVAGTSLTTQTFQQLAGLREQKQQQLENYFTQQQSDLAVLGKTVESFQKAAESKLAAIRDAKAATLMDYLSFSRTQLLDFAKRPKLIDAMESLPVYLRNYRYDREVSVDQLEPIRKELQLCWEEDFGQRYQEITGENALDLEGKFSLLSEWGIVIQQAYLLSNSHSLESKIELLKPKSELLFEPPYDLMHADFHPMVRNFAEEFGYQDVYLVDSENGDIVYSLRKRIDFGTSLTDGPFAESHLGEIFSRANSAEVSGEFFIADFEPYEPNFERPTAFMATPVFEENRKLGVLIFEFPVDKFKNVMNRRSGLGQTGETYLVGSDLLFRSDSYLNPTNFSMEVSFQDFEEVEMAQVLAGLSGESGVGVSRNYMNNHVLSAWSPFIFEDLNWVLMSEMRVREVLNPLDANENEFYRKFSELSDYNDLFLILPNGAIFYTVAQGADYRTNILSGNFKNSNLAKLVRKIGYGSLDIEQMNKGARFVDFAPYEPKGNAPAAFIAKGVKISNSLLGKTSQTSRTNLGSQLVVALQLSDSTLNEVMLQRTGLGETGESYLVGPDFKLRTSTRDPNRNLASSLSGEVSLNGADTEPVRLALEGHSDTGLYQNYNGDWVLASFSPIKVHDQTWALITEIQASEVLRPVWILGLVVLVLLLAVVALVIQLALFFSRNITEPVSQTALALQTIAEEQDLTVQVEVEQQDEIGQMAEAMRQMVSQLNSALQHVEWSSRQVQQESSVLESTGRQLAEQSSTQAASLEEISSSMVELNAQTKHNHELSTQASSRSQQMSRQAQASSEQMQRFSKMMAEIESSTENVTQITSLISEIAAQTRMLAINASIEAARAGVHGAGFAVVAQEVQELSAQTAESAEEIARVVGASVEKVQSGRKTLSEAQGSLEEIFGTTESVAEMMQMIRHAAEEQSQGIRQVNQALEELNQMTMENAQFSEVNAKSSSQLSKQAEELLAVVHQFRLWEEEEEEESESLAALPEPEENEELENHSTRETTNSG